MAKRSLQLFFFFNSYIPRPPSTPVPQLEAALLEAFSAPRTPLLHSVGSSQPGDVFCLSRWMGGDPRLILQVEVPGAGGKGHPSFAPVSWLREAGPRSHPLAAASGGREGRKGGWMLSALQGLGVGWGGPGRAQHPAPPPRPACYLHQVNNPTPPVQDRGRLSRSGWRADLQRPGDPRLFSRRQVPPCSP